MTKTPKSPTNPFSESTAGTKTLFVEIALPLWRRLDKEATDRRITKRSIVEKALEAYFDPNKQDERDALLARRLLNLDRRYEAIERENKIMAEAFNVFVMAWLVHNPELPPDQRIPASDQAKARHAKFVDRIAKAFEDRTTLYDQLPQSVIVGPQDFKKTQE